MILNYLPNSLAARLIVLHLVPVDWFAAGLAPPAPPSAPVHLLILGGYALLLGGLAIVLVRTSIYRSDAGE